MAVLDEVVRRFRLESLDGSRILAVVADEIERADWFPLEIADLEDLEEFVEGGSEGAEAAPKPVSEAGSSDLGAQVEELSREVRLLKEENREIRGMLEGIAAAAGSQIDILRVMREGLARGESTEPSADDQSGRGKG